MKDGVLTYQSCVQYYEFAEYIMILYNIEHNNFAVHSKTIICRIQCEHDIATQLTMVKLPLPSRERWGIYGLSCENGCSILTPSKSFKPIGCTVMYDPTQFPNQNIKANYHMKQDNLC
jgi:hypothetical protein